jgi:hypothetical protein
MVLLRANEPGILLLLFVPHLIVAFWGDKLPLGKGFKVRKPLSAKARRLRKSRKTEPKPTGSQPAQHRGRDMLAKFAALKAKKPWTSDRP